ncbi:MAG: hypothetical protein WDO24_12590 [Pseudomonadota bacterium]
MAAALAGAAGGAAAADKLHFAVGPFQPTATDTKKVYEPFFTHIAKALGVEYDLQATTDWPASRPRSPTTRPTSPGWARGATCSPTTRAAPRRSPW